MNARPSLDVPEKPAALEQRLRGTEVRPPGRDVAEYVEQARLMRCNLMVVGAMNGRHQLAFPSAYGKPAPDMKPGYLRYLVTALHREGIAAMAWACLNCRDLHNADECGTAKDYPESAMRFIEWDGHPATGKAAMCILTSPWRETHARALGEIAQLGVDGVFLDGFSLAGGPAPPAPGCVCRSCAVAFREETGREAPKRVDWEDPSFRRWIRWRQDGLLAAAVYFRDAMRQANPEIRVTCDFNAWGCEETDWESGVPLRAVDAVGTSQDACTGRSDMEWLLTGFKALLSHDMNPAQACVRRTSRPVVRARDRSEDGSRQERVMLNFMLAGLTYGTAPRHGGHLRPPHAGVHIHEEIRRREDLFGNREVRHAGVVLSQCTDDFFGHVPGTDNLVEYRDTLLGAFLIMSENHTPFRFFFDNQLEDGLPDDLKVLLLPETVCLSDAAAAGVREFARRGGKVVLTGRTGTCNEWGEPRGKPALSDIAAAVRLPGNPCLQWVRERDRDAEQHLCEAVGRVPLPYMVEAPPWLVVNPMYSHLPGVLRLHLLNASAFYRQEDTEFRGLAAEPPANNSADERVHTPASGAVIRLGTLLGARARLALSGDRIDIDNRVIRLPDIDDHEVLEIELG